MIDVVPTVADLNFYLRRFAPRVTLRLSPSSVTATSAQGEIHLRAAISYVRKDGRDIIVAVGEDGVGHPDATTVELFSAGAMASAEYPDLLDKFFCLVLKRLPATGAFIRPVVIVEGLSSFPPGSASPARKMIARALDRSGAAAVVM